jgi:hypothetical protein|tara:strand:+ start:384 stop:764 length:381 start_codon:yes stop_codon:yes gene_type:complete
MQFDLLHDGNYIMFAMKHYENPQCSGVEEFNEDINRIRYLKRLFRRYDTTGELRERLILNHIIIFYNVFGILPATRILFSRIEPDLHSLLKTFIVFLNNLPEESIPEADIESIPLNYDVVSTLRSL